MSDICLTSLYFCMERYFVFVGLRWLASSKLLVLCSIRTGVRYIYYSRLACLHEFVLDTNLAINPIWVYPNSLFQKHIHVPSLSQTKRLYASCLKAARVRTAGWLDSINPWKALSKYYIQLNIRYNKLTNRSCGTTAATSPCSNAFGNSV